MTAREAANNLESFVMDLFNNIIDTDLTTIAIYIGVIAVFACLTGKSPIGDYLNR